MSFLGIQRLGFGFSSGNGAVRALSAGSIPATLQAGDYIVVMIYIRDANASCTPAVANAGGQTWIQETVFRQSGCGSTRLVHCRYNGDAANLPNATFGQASQTEAQAIFVQYLRNLAVTAINGADSGLDSDDAGAGAASTSPFTVAGEVTSAPYCLNQAVHWTGQLNTYSSPTAGWEIAYQTNRDNGLNDYSVCLVEQYTPTASNPGNVSVTPNFSASRTSHRFAWRPALVPIRRDAMPQLLAH